MSDQRKPREFWITEVYTNLLDADAIVVGKVLAGRHIWDDGPLKDAIHVREVLPDAEAPAEFDEALKNFMDNVEKTGPANSFTQGWNAGFQQGLKARAGSRDVNIVELENENKDMKSVFETITADYGICSAERDTLKSTLAERDAEIEALKQEVQDAYSQGYAEAQERLDD